MSIRKAFAPLALTLGLGAGTAYAVNQVGELNLRADKIEACLQAPETTLPFCYEYPMTAAEISTLRDTAGTYGALGWIAFFATVSNGFLAAEMTKRKD